MSASAVLHCREWKKEGEKEGGGGGGRKRKEESLQLIIFALKFYLTSCCAS